MTKLLPLLAALVAAPVALAGPLPPGLADRVSADHLDGQPLQPGQWSAISLDINGDRHPEYVFELAGYCGSAGCIPLIYTGDRTTGQWRNIYNGNGRSSLAVFQDYVVMSGKMAKTNGWPDLYFKHPDPALSLLAVFNGANYEDVKPHCEPPNPPPGDMPAQ